MTYLKDSGFRSFAYTVHPFCAAGMANGPMPHIMSQMTSFALKLPGVSKRGQIRNCGERHAVACFASNSKRGSVTLTDEPVVLELQP